MSPTTTPASASTTTAPPAAPDAVARARAAQPAWAARGAVGRAAVLVEFGRLIASAQDELAALVVEEVAKPAGEAGAEVARAAAICAYYGGVGQEVGGVVRSSGDPSVMILAREQPVGVAGVITPWNFPLAIPAWKVVPALAAGCAVVWKPAPAAVRCARRLAELAHAAGVPEDVLVLLDGGDEAGVALSDADLDALSFTGSTAVGELLRGKLGPRSRPRLTLELGGVNVAHVLADADVPAAARDLVAAAFGFAGQKCTATQVIAVDRAVADALVDALEAELATVVATPVIDAGAAAALNAAIDRLGAGHRLLQAPAPPEPAGDRLVRPTLVLDHEGELTTEERFGPLATLVRTDGPEDHARLAAASGLALASAIYGRDASAIRRMVNLVGTGVVAVNRPSTGLDPHVPFGASGSDFSEQGREGLRFYTKWQTVYWRADGPGAEFP